MPAETHFNLAREGLHAGKHVLMEKPFVLCEYEGEKLIRLAKDEERILWLGRVNKEAYAN